MKINDRYEIRVVVLELVEVNWSIYKHVGDVYDNFEEFQKDKPNSAYKFGYVVFDTEYGYVSDQCNDWNDTPEEAMLDYRKNCCEES